MLMGVLLVVFSAYFFYFSSVHILMILLLVEFTLLIAVYILSCLCFSWFTFVMVILLGVCVGSFGVSTLICASRSKGSFYFTYF